MSIIAFVLSFGNSTRKNCTRVREFQVFLIFPRRSPPLSWNARSRPLRTRRRNTLHRSNPTMGKKHGHTLQDPLQFKRVRLPQSSSRIALGTLSVAETFDGRCDFAQRLLLEVLQEHGCDYLFPIKDNQLDILEAAKTCFAEVDPKPSDSKTRNSRSNALTGWLKSSIHRRVSKFRMLPR